ncbi:MAG TPA: sigma factor, partial [Bacteroidia bacterium]|nr:sigma factor [Bacteroidia bacterium]
MHSEEQHIVQAIRQGDERVFESLFRNHYQPLCRYATTLVNDPDEAEEIVQQVFIQIWERRGALEINLSIQAYLYKAVRNSSLNKIKHGKVRR